MRIKTNSLCRCLIFLVFAAGVFLILGSGASLYAQDDAGAGEETEETAVEGGETEVVAEGVIVEEEETEFVTDEPLPSEGPEKEITVEPELMDLPGDEEPKGGEAAAEEPSDISSEVQLDAQVPTSPGSARFFQLNAIVEFHSNLVSDDYSANDFYLHYYLKGNLNVTKNNRVSLRLDLAQQFIADEGETGLWFGDIRVYYTRKFKLMTWNDYIIPGMVYGYLTAPTSRKSIQRMIITKPTVVMALAPGIGPVTFIGRTYARYIFARYAQSKMADPNPQFSVGYDLQLLYQTPLDFLILSGAWSYTWTKDYRTREGDQQLWGAEYYWEVGATFLIPMPKKGPSLDISIAYAQGNNVMEGGVYRAYFVKRDQSEMYISLNLNY